MPTHYGPKVVTDGLVLALDAADRNSYPGSGTAWTDLSGRGNNGTLTNGVGYNSANRGSLVFDGVNDYVTSSQFSSLLTTTSGTLELWFKWISSPSIDFEPLCGFSETSTTRSVWIESSSIANNNTRFIWRLDSGTLGALNTGVTPNTNRNINHIVGTYQVVSTNITFSVYLNGNFVNSSTVSGSLTNAPTAPFEICGNGLTNDRYANANVYSTRVYNRALTAAEVSQNFQALRSRFSI